MKRHILYCMDSYPQEMQHLIRKRGDLVGGRCQSLNHIYYQLKGRSPGTNQIQR